MAATVPMDKTTSGEIQSSAHPYRFGPVVEGNRTTFRLWAPSAARAELLIEGHAPTAMQRGSDGFFSVSAACGAGTHYKFRIGNLEFPDLASRRQAGDTSGWSVVCEPLPAPTRRQPPPWHETIVCEVHVGTATPEGTFAGLTDRLEHFRAAGYTALEIMPINEFPGTRNWGYDGTLVFAPESSYGTPKELRALVDRAHELGLTMILDVVYNHFGEVDNFAAQYVPEWFSEQVQTPWGPGINFDQELVRRFYYENAVMWLTEYDFDGLRLDAVHEIKTEMNDRFLGELAQMARIARPHAHLIIENMKNSFRWLERNDCNEPMTYTAQWNDDMHHVLAFLVTGEGAMTGYDDPGKDPVADLEKALADGFVHDPAEADDSDGRTRGGPAALLPPDCFITYAQNHDQIGNRADGLRLAERIAPNRMDFINFVKFLAPHIPLCFMGDEGHLGSPFPFFVDLTEEDADAKRQQRYQQMNEIFHQPVEEGELPDPNARETFQSAKLDWGEFGRRERREALDRFRQLAWWRRELVWPLAATPCLEATTARSGSCLVVNWVFEKGTLSMALNPTGAPADIGCLICAKAVATGEYSQMGEVLRLSPWSAVAWVVES